MNERSIVIIGLKNCGKSSIGQLLAQNMRLPYYDADRLLEEHYRDLHQQRLSCRAIYSKFGKKFFDNMQRNVLQNFFARSGLGALDVLALGGGAGDLDEIGRLLEREDCVVVLLEETLPMLFKRIRKSGLPPFLQGTATEDTTDLEAAFAKFCDLSEQRLRHYRAWSDIALVCTGRSTDDLAAELQNILQNILAGV